MFYGFAEGYMAMEKLNLAKASLAQKEAAAGLIGGDNPFMGGLDPAGLGADGGDGAPPADTGTPPDTGDSADAGGEPFVVGARPDTVVVDPTPTQPDKDLVDATDASIVALGLIIPPLGWVGEQANRLLGRTIGGDMDVPPKPNPGRPKKDKKSWVTKVPVAAAKAKPVVETTSAQTEFDAGEAGRQEEERLSLEAEATKAIGNYGGND